MDRSFGCSYGRWSGFGPLLWLCWLVVTVVARFGCGGWFWRRWLVVVVVVGCGCGGRLWLVLRLTKPHNKIDNKPAQAPQT